MLGAAKNPVPCARVIVRISPCPYSPHSAKEIIIELLGRNEKKQQLQKFLQQASAVVHLWGNELVSLEIREEVDDPRVCREIFNKKVRTEKRLQMCDFCGGVDIPFIQKEMVRRRKIPGGLFVRATGSCGDGEDSLDPRSGLTML